MQMLSRLLAVALAAVLVLPAEAEQWPARGLRILTGTPPGGSPDFVSRLLAEKLVDRLNWEIHEILKLPDIRDKLAIVGNVPMPSTPEQMQDHIEQDAARWSRIVDLKGIEKY